MRGGRRHLVVNGWRNQDGGLLSLGYQTFFNIIYPFQTTERLFEGIH